MLCKYCDEKVNKVINFRGTIICMDCYKKKKGPEEVMIEEENEKTIMERIERMHSEKYD